MRRWTRDRALIRTGGRQLGWLSSTLVVTPIVLATQYQPSWTNPTLEGSLLTFVSEDAQAQPSVTRYDSATDSVKWSTPIGAVSPSDGFAGTGRAR